jgi:hypothetical protein
MTTMVLIEYSGYNFLDQGGRQNRRKNDRFRKGGQGKKYEKTRNQISEEDFDDPSKFPPLGSSLNTEAADTSKKEEKKPEPVVEEEKVQTIPEVKLDTTKKAEDVGPAIKSTTAFVF